jgi:hypothetical protein
LYGRSLLGPWCFSGNRQRANLSLCLGPVWASKPHLCHLFFASLQFSFPASRSASFNPVRFAWGAPFVDLLQSNCSVITPDLGVMVVSLPGVLFMLIFGADGLGSAVTALAPDSRSFSSFRSVLRRSLRPNSCHLLCSFYPRWVLEV